MNQILKQIYDLNGQINDRVINDVIKSVDSNHMREMYGRYVADKAHVPIMQRDVANSYKATVMKFDGTNWVAVGTPGFSAGEAALRSRLLRPVFQVSLCFQLAPFSPLLVVQAPWIASR